jgi:hypothetical protein
MVLHGDVTTRPLLQRAKDEDEVQNWIVEQINHRSRGRLQSITAMRCFTFRWSCSITLFRYFDERSLVFAGSEPAAFSSRTAR